jgi:hypothetical protein
MKNALLGRAGIAPWYLLPFGNSQSSTSLWTDPERCDAQRFASVFILAITQDLEIRTMVETALADVVGARGLKSTRGVDVYPKSLKGENAPTREELWARIQALGCDVIFTIAILDVKSEQRYSPGTAAYAPCPRYPFYGEFDTYYGYLQNVVSSQEYFAKEKIYFLEGNLFDATTGRIQWSMQSIEWDPSELESFSKEFALLLVDQLKKPKELQL